MSTYLRLGDLLVKSGAITQEQLDQALALQKKSGKRLGAVLVEYGIISEMSLISALTSQIGVEYIDLNSCEIPAEMAQILPRSIARKYTVVPVRATRTELFLAMADPLNFVAVEEVSAATRRHVVPMITTEAAALRAVQNLYSNQGAARAIEEMRREMQSSQAAVPVLQNQESIVLDDENSDTAPAIRLVNSIIERACAEKASDIHMEPGEDCMTIRMRIDGMLRRVITVPKELVNSVVSRLKIMSHLDIAQRNMPQDGHTNVTVRQEQIDLRISTLPTIYGENIVIRLLHKNPELITMDGIGLRGGNLDRFTRLLGGTKDGAILMVGPTGSGKTSTMYTIINRLRSEVYSLVSLEDPAEYHIDGVCQVQINDKVGLTFANALRAVLRQDPDIIAVGEIRDSETAQIAMRAAITGHLVLTTIHTNDAASSVDRLLDLGVEPFILASAVKGIISQRLVRRICPHCRKSYQPSAEECRTLGFSPFDTADFYRGEGCDECFHTGYRGRIGVFEILEMTPELRRAIYSGDREKMEAAVRGSRFVPMLENCRELIRDGITTSEEIVRSIGYQGGPAAGNRPDLF